jgi:hypothetical protein
MDATCVLEEGQSWGYCRPFCMEDLSPGGIHAKGCPEGYTCEIPKEQLQLPTMIHIGYCAKSKSCDPKVYRACGDDLICVADSMDSNGICKTFDHGQTVGAGYYCGGSIGVSCAQGLTCDGLPVMDIEGGTGICMAPQPKTCEEVNGFCFKSIFDESTKCPQSFETIDAFCNNGAICCREKSKTATSCDPRQAICDMVMPVCKSNSQVPSVVDGCWGPCVEITSCSCDKNDSSTYSSQCPLTGFICGADQQCMAIPLPN